jgi:hypothetical protein
MEKLITTFRNISYESQMAQAVCECLREGTVTITDIWGGGCDLVESCRRFERNCRLHLQVPSNRLESPEGGRGIALHSLDLGARRGWKVKTTPRPLYPREIPGTHGTGGWVGPRAGLEVGEKYRPCRDSIPGPSTP